MHFLTPTECRDWCTSARTAVDTQGIPVRPHHSTHNARANIPRDFTHILRFCQGLERSLRPYRGCLLWVTASDIWESGVNWHLYYRMRQSYGDLRQLNEAPGHVFLAHEVADFVTFIEIAALSGFDAHLVTDSTACARAFISHDEFVEFTADDHNPELVREFTIAIESGT
jgi:hypothetical protein